MRAEGREAESRLAEAGWAVAAAKTPLHLFGDQILSGDFAARRVWLTPSVLRHVPSPEQKGRRFVASLVLEGGGIERTSDGRRHRIVPGAFVLHDVVDPVEIDTAEPIAIMQVESRWDRLLTLGPPGPARFRASASYAQVLSSLLNAVFSAEVRPSAPSFPTLVHAIEATVSSLLAEHDSPPWNDGTAAERELYQRAVALISTAADDPHLTVENLASELNVSHQYLQRAFRPTGLSPMRYVRQVRARNARALIARLRPISRDDYETIARQTGFGSVITMRRVLAREP